MYSSMFTYEMVNKERHKDRLREVERQRLIQAAGLEQSGNIERLEKVANLIGIQMVRWGSKLPGNDPVHRQALKGE